MTFSARSRRLIGAHARTRARASAFLGFWSDDLARERDSQRVGSEQRVRGQCSPDPWTFASARTIPSPSRSPGTRT